MVPFWISSRLKAIDSAYEQLRVQVLLISSLGLSTLFPPIFQFFSADFPSFTCKCTHVHCQVNTRTLASVRAYTCKWTMESRRKKIGFCRETCWICSVECPSYLTDKPGCLGDELSRVRRNHPVTNKKWMYTRTLTSMCIHPQKVSITN